MKISEREAIDNLIRYLTLDDPISVPLGRTKTSLTKQDMVFQITEWSKDPYTKLLIKAEIPSDCYMGTRYNLIIELLSRHQIKIKRSSSFIESLTLKFDTSGNLIITFHTPFSFFYDLFFGATEALYAFAIERKEKDESSD